MRWRRDHRDTRYGVTEPRDHRGDLVRRKLAALTGFRSLSHLDLELLGVSQVLRGYPESSRSDLLGLVVGRIAPAYPLVPRRVFTTLAGVAARSDSVHRDRDRLVRLGAESSEGHRLCGE